MNEAQETSLLRARDELIDENRQTADKELLGILKISLYNHPYTVYYIHMYLRIKTKDGRSISHNCFTRRRAQKIEN